MIDKFTKVYRKIISEQANENFDANKAEDEMTANGFKHEGGSKFSKEIQDGFFFPVILYVSLNENGKHTANLALKDPSYAEDAKKTLWFCNDDAAMDGRGNLLVVDASTSVADFLEQVKDAIKENLDKAADGISNGI